jgi:SAM-dependent methyltransferase
MIRIIEKILLKYFPRFYLGLTRAQDSNDRFLFGSDFIKKNKKDSKISILDVGCGGGNFFAYINSVIKNADYFGVDFDYEKMNENKFDDYKNFKIISQDLRSDWFFKEHDFVWSSEVIEHLFDDQNFFKKLVKSTKKNGYIIITTPYYNSYVNFAKKYDWPVEVSKEEIIGHVRLGYNENDLQKLAKLNNLKLENIFFISECDNFRAKNIFRMNNGLFCYFFNILYNLKILNYKKFNVDKNLENKMNYLSIAAIYKKQD